MFSILPILLTVPVLVLVAYCDLRFMRIPNVLSILLVVLFVGSSLVFPPNDLLMRVSVAAGVFGLGFVGFCFRLLGGGDVKILAALMLFVPVQNLEVFSFLFSGSLLLGVLTIVGLRRLPQTAGHPWKSLSGSVKFPMGISIALAGILHAVYLMASYSH